VSDLLRMDYINSLPQPFRARFCGGDVWPVESICVQTGLVRVDVCGKLQVMSFGDVMEITDESGRKHNLDDWYLEDEQ
jgi:hypothetical protein